MKCTCGLEVVTVERKMACPACGSELILSYDSELAELRAKLEAAEAREAELRRAAEQVKRIAQQWPLNLYMHTIYRLVDDALAQPEKGVER